MYSKDEKKFTQGTLYNKKQHKILYKCVCVCALKYTCVCDVV